MKAVTGDEWTGCPWRVFHEPYVYEVLQAYRWFESGQVAIHFGGIDAPNVIVDGVGHYHATLNRLRIDEMDRDDAKSKQQRGQAPTVALDRLELICDG